MLKDEELVELHQNRNYKRQNGFFRNFKYSFKILGIDAIKRKKEDFLDGKSFWKRAVEEFIWIFIRYAVVTKELVECRNKVVEGILSGRYEKNIDNLVKDSIGVECQWLEYNAKKLEIIKNMCLSYFSIAENRMMYIKASSDPGSMENELKQAYDKLHQVFDNEIDKLNRKTAKGAVEELLNDEQSVQEITKIIMDNSRDGRLTGKISRESQNGN